jgi:putative tryptophan/tyrosine transport system substrate-binding protein
MRKNFGSSFLDAQFVHLKPNTFPGPCRRIQNLKQLGVIALLVTLGMCGAMVHAQPQAKIPRIGYLAVSSSSPNRTEPFRQGLRELGYVEGKNIIIEWRFAEGNRDRVRELAAELVHLKVSVIVTGGPGATHPTKQATQTIPIVMGQDSDPVGNGFVVSLARPGGNVTGLSNLTPELSGKQLELLKEIVPGLSRLALLRNSNSKGVASILKELELAASPLKIKLQSLDVFGANDIETAFRAAKNSRADAVIVMAGPVINAHRRQIADLAVKSRLPVIYDQREYVEAGGLISYGASIPDLFRRVATYVDKILKGAKPADLPVEQPTKFELVINLDTAKQIGLTIPPNVLARADKVIK